MRDFYGRFLRSLVETRRRITKRKRKKNNGRKGKHGFKQPVPKRQGANEIVGYVLSTAALMYISARFAAPSRKFWFNFRRLASSSRNLEIAVLTGDKRDEGRRKKNNKLVSFAPTIAITRVRDNNRIPFIFGIITNYVRKEN